MLYSLSPRAVGMYSYLHRNILHALLMHVDRTYPREIIRISINIRMHKLREQTKCFDTFAPFSRSLSLIVVGHVCS